MRELLNGTDDDGRNYANLLVAHAFERAMARERDSLACMRFIRDTTEGHLNTVTDDEPSISDEKRTDGGRPGHEPE